MGGVHSLTHRALVEGVNRMDDLISRQAAIDALCKQCTVDRPETCSTIQKGDKWCEEVYTLLKLPSAQPQTEWNNHTVACLLAELFGDACACNYNGIDE